MDLTPRVNTHVHIPPNFSAFTTVAEVIQAGKTQGLAVLGVSNFYDHQVYSLIKDLGEHPGVLLSYGVEFITHLDDLAEEGITEWTVLELKNKYKV